MMSTVEFKKFKDPENLASKLSGKICKILKDSIANKGKASIALSGGNTPKKLFEKLSLCKIDWRKVTVSLVDERWLSSDNLDSNEKLIKTCFLKNFAINAKFIGMYQNETNLDEAKKNYEKTIKEKLLPFDIIVLGMGNDGHTASLFPNNEKFEEAFNSTNALCMGVTQKDIKYNRLSLTRSTILSARHIFLHFEGKEKLDIYNLALKTKDINKYPISSILNQKQKNIEVYFA